MALRAPRLPAFSLAAAQPGLHELLRAEADARRASRAAAHHDQTARAAGDPRTRRDAEREAVRARQAALRGRVCFLLTAGPERDDLLVRLDAWAAVADPRTVDALIAALAYADSEGATS